jgi:hypothetical protein
VLDPLTPRAFTAQRKTIGCLFARPYPTARAAFDSGAITLACNFQVLILPRQPLPTSSNHCHPSGLGLTFKIYSFHNIATAGRYVLYTYLQFTIAIDLHWHEHDLLAITYFFL